MADLECGIPGPGNGRGKETIRVRNAVAGIEASKEFVVLRFDSFSIKGAKISLGALAAKGPRLDVKVSLIRSTYYDSAYHLMA